MRPVQRGSCSRWLLCAVLVLASCALERPAFAGTRWRGWDWLVEKLLAEGVDRAQVEAVFLDSRLPPFDGVRFSPKPPVESPWRYRMILRPEAVRLARECLERHRGPLVRAERLTSVPAPLLAALLTVESRCGRNVGRERVFYRLARLAMANEPGNLARNIDELCERDCSPELVQGLRSRAQFLESTFFPEVKATFVVAKRLGVPVLELRGSSAGAFGWPQFLPGSYLRFGRDGNGDGRVDLFDVEDAVLSAAEYLRAHGWERDAPMTKKREALWAYNRSHAYGEAVLALTKRLETNGRKQDEMGRAPRDVQRTVRARAASAW